MTTLFALIGLSLTPSPPQATIEAERHFAAGAAARDDADVARVHFAKAAHLYDELWEHPVRNAALAKNRARAHRLAGNLPAAVAALHDGLRVARYDRSLQVEMEDARGAVEYFHADLAAACRPAPLRGISTRMSPAEAYLITAVLWVAACFGVARYRMTRVPGWLFASAASLVLLAILAGFWWQDARRQASDAAKPLIIVSQSCDLKAGNGELWPDRLKWKLPPGAELRELARRGGWIQVELVSGTVGWIPEDAAITLPVG
jgi:hypothetical protein